MPDLEKMAETIYADLKATVEAVAKAHGLRGFGLVIPMVLTSVESLARGITNGALTGDQKKDIAVRVLNRFIDLPVLPEWAEAKVIALAVDWFVGFFNRSFGRGWLDTIRGINFGV